MWDALWSLYDEKPEPNAAPSSASPKHRTIGTRAGNRGRGGGSVNIAAAIERGRHAETVANNLQSSLHSTSTSSNGSSSKRQANAPSDCTSIIRGVIVGEKKSGKTSLIRRLRGEDPFRRHDQTRNGHDDNNVRQRNLMALIPWKLPHEAPFHQTHNHSADSDDAVQLYVSEGKSFCYSNEGKSFRRQWTSVLQSQRGGKECDFVVWMIDPRMDNVIKILQQGLDILFPSLETPDSNGSTPSGKASVQDAGLPLTQNLCILVNFRDLNPSQQNDSKGPLVEQVQHVVEQVIACHNKYHQKQRRSPPDDTYRSPNVLVYESSMKHCYGLQNLHSFFTLPYLYHKEQELRRRAEHARKQHFQWKQGLMEAKVVPYRDFVQQRLGEPKKSTTKQSLERQKLEEEKDQLQLRLKQQNQLLLAKSEGQEASKQSGSSVRKLHREVASPSKTSMTTSSDQLEEDGVKQAEESAPPRGNISQRKLFSKSGQSPPSIEKVPPSPAVTEHNNLDSFFSDDEEDEKEENGANFVGNASSDSSDDDDSDDEGDFYIDVSGTRYDHASVPSSKHTKQSPEEKKIDIKKASIPDTDEEVHGVTAEFETKSKNEINDANSESKDDVDPNINAQAEHSSSVEDEEEDQVNDAKSEVCKSSTSDNDDVNEILDGHNAIDSAKNKSLTPETSLPNKLSEDETRAQIEIRETNSENKDDIDSIDNVRAKHYSSVEDEEEDQANDAKYEVCKPSISDNEALDGHNSTDSAKDKSLEPDASSPNKLSDYETKAGNEIRDTNSEDKDVVDSDSNAQVEHSSSVEDDEEEQVNDTESEVRKPSISHNAEVNEKLDVHDANNSDENKSSEPDTSSLDKVAELSENANAPVPIKMELWGTDTVTNAHEDGSSDESTTEQIPRDDSSNLSNAKPKAAVNNVKADNDEGHNDNDEETPSCMTVAETDERQHPKQSVGNLQHRLVMDSDDESSDLRNEEHTRDTKSKDGLESEISGGKHSIHDSVAAARQFYKPLPPKPSMPDQPVTGDTIVHTPVSIAALAAIEAAKREAEQMMAQSQSNLPHIAKREKKSKKKKDGDKKKKRKKEKKQKD